MAVHLSRPPHNVRLEAWGRAEDGWWGCVTWRQRVAVRGAADELPIAAWVPAGAITRPAWSRAVELTRIELPASRRAWPAPPGWPYWYAGVWPDGPMPLPPGAEVLTGPAWRARR